MKKLAIVSIASILFAAGTSGAFAASCCASGASASDHEASAGELVLTSYEHVVHALAQDKLEEARNAARTLSVLSNMGEEDALAEESNALVSADSLDAAREQFRKVSAEALEIVNGENGYHVFVCPGAGDDGVWIQAGEEARNPYLGSKNPDCGELTSAEEAIERVRTASVRAGSANSSETCDSSKACCDREKECADKAKKDCEGKTECGERTDCESKKSDCADKKDERE